MKIAVFGASGRTGGLLAERCLASGYKVSSLVRTPKSYRFWGQTEVVEGSVFDLAAVRRTVAGADVVLSALGARSLKKEDVLERAVPVIVEAMRAEGVRRIVALGGASAMPGSLDKQPAVLRWFLRRVLYEGVLKWPSASQRAQWEVLSASGLDFTMVLPPMLTDGKALGKYRVDGEALPPRGSRIARADLADFMVAQIEGKEWVGKGVYLAY
jgi:putative NADH-flavin reductase